MTQYRNLVAKSWDTTSCLTPPANERLLPHLRAVQVAGDTIVEVCGTAICANLALNPVIWLPRLRLAVSMSALLHDLGKANSYFQGMVRGDRDFPSTAQPIRHELLTVLMLLRNSGGLADWLRGRLEKGGQADVAGQLFRSVVGAIAGHHVKMDCDWRKAFGAMHCGGGGIAFEIYLGHANLRPLFGDDRTRTDETWSLLKSGQNYPGTQHLPFNMESVGWQDYLHDHPEWLRFAAAVKALAVAADVAGSALLPEKVSIKDWITDALVRRVSDDKLHEVARRRLDGHPIRPFQRAIALSTSHITLVEAGCASGKTVAAYLWAANHAKGRKLFFCYPTTGTATEGFLDYVAPSEVEAALIHSRAVVDLDRVAMSRDAPSAEEQEDEQLRVSALNTWAPEAVVCTIDTVLALPRNNRRGLYGAPAILSGCFIFDELHAYDDDMYAALVALIRAMPGAPFLLMSASLPAHRKAYLEQSLGEIGRVEPPAELESIPRYHIQRAEVADAFAQATERVRNGERVLWICNVVARAQSMFDQAKAAGLPVVAYHSRFRYQDRVMRHREVVDGFGGLPGNGLLAVTTQVAEMSLDLDADFMVTELAPVPSLIQRLGRLNRRVSESRPGRPRTALALTPESEKPYNAVELEKANAWLTGLTALPRPLSQRDLADQFLTVSEQEQPRWDARVAWLDSGWCAWPQSVREPGFSVNVILPEDIGACRADRNEIIRRGLPMIYHIRMESWHTLRGTFIAPPGAIQYDAHRGAAWAD